MRLQNLEMRRQSLFSTVHTYSLLMNLKNFVCNIGEDAELLMSLYDPDQSEFIRLGPRLAAAAAHSPVSSCFCPVSVRTSWCAGTVWACPRKSRSSTTCRRSSR